MTENTYNYVAENVKRIQDDIAEACIKYGRDPLDVTLMGVSKTQPVEKLIVAKEAGITVFGENKVQELIRKADFFKRNNVPCHIIGTLQTNKVKYLPSLTDTIQSVDSLKLAKEIEKQYGKAGKKANICLEINIGSEESKGGITYDSTMELVHQLSEFKNLTVKGLM
ncbi:MAG: YggS family pyridoxal phosphate-dependent enzyme, partial [Oscillospiraceae bacterium]|nr:YggS family pyridoxal phosphate-dependent enzyme [Oscillospiraceae bacterium]